MSDLSRILVVDDQSLLLLTLVDELADFGFNPVPAASAGTAARLLDTGIDALVTDIDLGPGPDGLALARLAAQARPDLPIVVVSGGHHPTSAELPAGAVFLPKPYHVAEIVACLRRQQMARAA
jgi:DNA-binding NtrC family response regulator